MREMSLPAKALADMLLFEEIYTEPDGINYYRTFGFIDVVFYQGFQWSGLVSYM